MDGYVAIGGCDKNMPGCMIAIARMNRPAVFVYGGTILPGCVGAEKKDADIVTVFEAVGQHANCKISDAQLQDIEEHSIPGEGSCGGMYTANTMASAIEALGMSLPNSGAQAAVSSDKLIDCFDAGAAVMNMIKLGITPRDIMTKEAFENAITLIITLGGSTNAVLHLIAMAHAAGVKLGIDDFVRIGKKTPVLADLKPSGKYFMNDLVKIGGTVPLIRLLVEEGLMHGGCLTVTGRTMKENMQRSCGRRARPSSVRSPTRSRRTATSSSSAAISAPKVPSARFPARKASASAARPSSSRAKKPPCRPF
jgi:dihydroxy-acid dehydratase